MRFIAIARLISPVPPEELPSIMERFAEWREQYREHLQSFEFFAGSPGAVMIINAPDEVVLNQVMTEYPFVNYVDLEVRPIIDGDTALAQWWQVMRRMVGDSGPAESPGVSSNRRCTNNHSKRAFCAGRLSAQQIDPKAARKKI